MIFTSYALNDQELDVLKKEIEKDNLNSLMKEFIQGATEESLGQIKKDIEDFLSEGKEKKEEPKPEKEDINPFKALFTFFYKDDDKKDKKKEDKDLSKGIEQDDLYEKIVRSQAIIAAREKTTTLFDLYKKAHQMPSYP